MHIKKISKILNIIIGINIYVRTNYILLNITPIYIIKKNY